MATENPAFCRGFFLETMGFSLETIGFSPRNMARNLHFWMHWFWGSSQPHWMTLEGSTTVIVRWISPCFPARNLWEITGKQWSMLSNTWKNRWKVTTCRSSIETKGLYEVYVQVLGSTHILVMFICRFSLVHVSAQASTVWWDGELRARRNLVFFGPLVMARTLFEVLPHVNGWRVTNWG